MAGGFSELAFKLEGPTSEVVVLTQPLFYFARDEVRYAVPKGFRNDLASVPKWLRSVTARWQRTARAGVLHDCAYRWAERWDMTRREADDLYYEALRSDGLGRARSYVQWRTLRMFGWKAWNKWRETKEGEKGLPPGPPRRREYPV